MRATEQNIESEGRDTLPLSFDAFHSKCQFFIFLIFLYYKMRKKVWDGLCIVG